MRILLVGSGGREHALAWALSASPLCDRLFVAPGNAGIAEVATCVPIGELDIDALISFARQEAIDFVVVGPEAPLVAGLVDRLEASGVAAFGPTAAAARIEGSKAFMKDLCRKYGVPTAEFGRFTEPEAAKAFVRTRGRPMVVKTDGLAAGKGVTVARTLEETLAAIDETRAAFGAAAAEIVVEEVLEGEEASFFALADGEHVLPLVAAQDHKAVGDGDTGPNTGGMGTYSPTPVFDQAMAERVMREIVRPSLDGLAAEGAPYKGVLFAGLMLTRDGPKLIEFNARFGDPETQVLMPRLMSDLLPALIACREGNLHHIDLRWRPDAAVCVVMASRGYPGDYAKGTVIEGLDAAAKVDGVTIFHAGTARRDGRLVATGGRVLGVTGTGRSVGEAQARAYRAVDAIRWPEGFCRRDIGWRAIALERRG